MKRLHSIRTRLLLFAAGVFVLTALFVLLAADYQLTRITDRSQAALYEQKLATIINILESRHERLLRTGQIEAYRDDFMNSTIGHLTWGYYLSSDQLVYPCIINTEYEILMHPELLMGKRSPATADFFSKVITLKNGDFDYVTESGERMWCVFRFFKEWNWIVFYSFPQEVKYGDVSRLRNSLLVTLLVLGLVVIAILSLIVTRMTRPLRRLTTASIAMTVGDLDHIIDIGARDEIGILARSFMNMRDSIRAKIRDLQREITEHRKAERELRDSNELLEQIFSTTHFLLAYLDSDFNFIRVNEAYARAGNQPQDYYIGKNHFGLYPNKENQAIFQGVVDTGEPFSVEAKRFHYPGQVERDTTYWDWSLIPVKDEAGRVHRLVLSLNDVTEAKKMEAELLKTQKLESIGILAGGIAHDFNNLLTAILGNISFASMSSNTATIAERLAEAERASVRAQELARQLLTFSKGGAPVKKIISLGDLLETTVAFTLRGANISCEFAISPDLFPLEVDVGQLSQVISNLSINADQAMAEGGKLKVQAGNVAVGENDPLSIEAGDYVKVCFEDQGSGIAAEHLTNIFDPFFTTKKGGSGLGLSISHSIIKNHGGCITVDSQAGQGAVFCFYLPAAQKKSLEKLEKSLEGVLEEPALLPGSGKILVLDDEEMIRKLITRILSHAGYEVEPAADGSEVIDLYRQALKNGEPFDAVIMDLTIPGGMGGKETIKKLLEIDPQVKAIVSSGYSEDPIMTNYEQYGFCSMLSKPYNSKDIYIILQQVLAAD